MTREEAKKILGENVTDEQVTSLLNKVHEEQKDYTNDINSLKGQVNNLTSLNTELQQYKDSNEADKKAKLSEEERMEVEKQEIAKTKKEYALLLNSAKAKSILIGTGISEEEADNLVKTIVKEDENITIASAQVLATQINNIKEKTTKQTMQDIRDTDIKPNSSNLLPDDKGITNWEEFSKLSEEDQAKFIENNPEAFDNF